MSFYSFNAVNQEKYTSSFHVLLNMLAVSTWTIVTESENEPLERHIVRRLMSCRNMATVGVTQDKSVRTLLFPTLTQHPNTAAKKRDPKAETMSITAVWDWAETSDESLKTDLSAASTRRAPSWTSGWFSTGTAGCPWRPRRRRNGPWRARVHSWRPPSRPGSGCPRSAPAGGCPPSGPRTPYGTEAHLENQQWIISESQSRQCFMYVKALRTFYSTSQMKEKLCYSKYFVNLVAPLRGFFKVPLNGRWRASDCFLFPGDG